MVSHALSRGWLRREQLREALLLQRQLERSGRPTPLLELLRARHLLRPEHVEELKRIYLRGARTQGMGIPPTVSLEPTQPLPADDAAVREFIDACEASVFGTASSGRHRTEVLPGHPLATDSVAAARASGELAYREALRLDPHFAPHIDAALERLETLGEGGQGVVYRVRDRRLGREAALKLIRADRGSAHAVRRFRREVEVTARLDHPSIPPVYEAGTSTEGHHFMLMRVVEGQPLSAKIGAFHDTHAGLEDGARELRELLEALVKVGEAAAYAHSQGIVHRDLKPGNVMIGRFGEVMVLDWGLARFQQSERDDEEDAELITQLTQGQLEQAGRERLTLPGTVLGTLGYAAPEQARGEPVDERADVFALGAILSEILTGEPTLKGDSFVELLVASREGKVVLPGFRRADVAPELRSIAGRALAKRPDHRYRNAEAFVADLRAYLGDDEVSAHRYGIRERFQRFTRRHVTVLVGLGVGAVALLGVGLALAFAEQQQAKAEHEQAERRLADEQRAQSERFARELADEKTKSLVYTDGGRLKILIRQARTLGARPGDAPALEAWLEEAKALLAPRRRSLHESRARILRDLSQPTTAQQAQLEALEKLLTDLSTLARPTMGDPPAWDTVASVEARLAFARDVREQTVTGPEARAAWAKARRGVAREPKYAGLRLKPVLGLVPIGPDPTSGLWEFWHVQSGARPQRGADGRLRVTEAGGLVLVLVPAGRFRMGSKTRDEHPVHPVRLSAFLLSKYELTQGQWLRATGSNPSDRGPGQRSAGSEGITLLHPVEQVSWDDCQEVLQRLALRLPSEAEWEYAARAGTRSTWWTGDGKGSLEGAANVKDQSYKAVGGTHNSEPWSDGFSVHAPVGSFAPNPFGLHDAAGNVWEWVQDAYHPGYQGAPGDGSAWGRDPSNTAADASNRIYRGGGWSSLASYCRSAFRYRDTPERRSANLGLRPAMTVEPDAAR